MKPGGYRSTSAKNKAIITVARAILITVWHALATGTPYQEPGAGYLDRRPDPERETRRRIAKPEAPGHQVTLDAAV
jgi:transposase